MAHYIKYLGIAFIFLITCEIVIAQSSEAKQLEKPCEMINDLQNDYDLRKLEIHSGLRSNRVCGFAGCVYMSCNNLEHDLLMWMRFFNCPDTILYSSNTSYQIYCGTKKITIKRLPLYFIPQTHYNDSEYTYVNTFYYNDSSTIEFYCHRQLRFENHQIIDQEKFANGVSYQVYLSENNAYTGLIYFKDGIFEFSIILTNFNNDIELLNNIMKSLEIDGRKIFE